jgi:hypothetical protein
MQKVTICPPRYAYGYRPAACMYHQYGKAQEIRTMSNYQRREEHVMKMFDRTIEINP